MGHACFLPDGCEVTDNNGVFLNNIAGINSNLTGFHKLTEAIVIEENSWNQKATLTKTVKALEAADKVRVCECVINAAIIFSSPLPEQCTDLTVSQMERKTPP